MPNMHPYLVYIAFKYLLVLNHLITGEALLEVLISEINVVISEYCCCVIAPLVRYSLQLGI